MDLQHLFISYMLLQWVWFFLNNAYWWSLAVLICWGQFSRGYQDGQGWRTCPARRGWGPGPIHPREEMTVNHAMSWAWGTWQQSAKGGSAAPLHCCQFLKPLRNLVRPCFEQVVGQETSRGLFQSAFSCSSMILRFCMAGKCKETKARFASD